MSRGWMVGLLVLIVVGLWSVPAVAAPPGGGDIFGAFQRDLALWTLIVFLGLLYLLKKVAWGPILEGLQRREETIKKDLDDARREREDAEKLRRKYEQDMAKVHEKIRELMEEARRDGQYTRDEMVAKAREEIQIERERLLREVELARDQALQAIWIKSVELAALLSSKFMRQTITVEGHRQLLDESLAEMSRNSNN